MNTTTQAAIALTLLASTASHAQTAVQWKVADGGNGHWYQRIVIPGGITWTAARDQATVLGGHLATISTAAENSFVFQSSGVSSWATRYGPWLGGFQTPASVEPGVGWRWVTDERWTFTNWDGAEPNNGCNTNPDENALQFIEYGAGWNDIPDDGRCDTEGPVAHFMVEWDADCNNDGTVDYGQCRDGTLPDYNGNNVPDCCESGTPCVVGNYPVQWRVEEGGNGHWYFRLAMPLTSWEVCRIEALQRGGDLVSISSLAEYQAALRVVTEEVSTSVLNPVWLGATCPVGSSGSANWSWIDGTPWEFTAWCSFSPNNGPEQMRYLIHYTHFGCWDDYLASDACCHVGGAIMEWSADCNNDGIVDYGQILTGQLADLNGNGIPDVCEGPTCRDADLFRDLNVNGADLGILLSQWGPNSQFTVSDINKDGFVNGADLGILLSFWGACP